MKLYYATGACSIGIHVLLEEIGAPYELHRVDTRAGEQHRPEYLALSPKAKVPTLLRANGAPLTEFGAIATYLARLHPEAGLIPADADAEALVRETMDYAVGTIHGQGFGRVFRPENFTPTAADQDAVKAKGREMIAKGLAILDKALDGRPYVGGAQLSVADAAVFYIAFWCATRVAIAMPPNLAMHYARMTQRPAVQKVLADEGLTA